MIRKKLKSNRNKRLNIKFNFIHGNLPLMMNNDDDDDDDDDE